MPYWRSLPQVLNKAATHPNAVPSPLELAAVLNRPVGIDPELVRSQLLTLTRSLAAVPPEFVSPEFHVRVQRIESEITKLDGNRVLELQTMVQERLPEPNTRKALPNSTAATTRMPTRSTVTHTNAL